MQFVCPFFVFLLQVYSFVCLPAVCAKKVTAASVVLAARLPPWQTAPVRLEKMPLRKFLDSNCKVPVSNIFRFSGLLICWKCTLTWQGPGKVWRALLKGKFFPIFLLPFRTPKNHLFLPTYPVFPFPNIEKWSFVRCQNMEYSIDAEVCGIKSFGYFWDKDIQKTPRIGISSSMLFWWWDLDAEESFDLRFVPEEVVWPAPEHNGSISLIIFLTQSLLLQWNRVVQVVFPVKVFRPWLLLDILRPVFRALGQT